MKSYSRRLVSWSRFWKVGFFVVLQIGLWMTKGLPCACSNENTVKQTFRIFEKYHVSQRRVDDAFAQEMFERFFATLDPHKLYFRQQDIDSLLHHKTEIDDQLQLGRINFCQDAFQLFQQRVAQQNKIADQQI